MKQIVKSLIPNFSLSEVVCAVIATTLFFVVVTLPLGKTYAWDQTLENNKDDIQRMTKTEREEILNKYHLFKKLSPEQKKNLRELNKATRENDKLYEAKMVYHHWLRSLDLMTRAELRNEKDPQKRIKLVKILLAKQKSQKKHGVMDSFNFFTEDNIFKDGRPEFSQEELNAIFKIVKKNISLTNKQKKDLKNKKPLHKQILFLSLLQGKKGIKIDNKTFDQMINSVENEKIIQKLEDAKNTEARKHQFINIVRYSLISAVQTELTNQKPSATEEKEFFDQLDSAHQDRLLSLPEEIRKSALRFFYLKKKDPQFFNLLMIVGKNINRPQTRRPPPFSEGRDKRKFRPRKRFHENQKTKRD